jgi:steroid delta-isomerase-like uncharacterized protein
MTDNKTLVRNYIERVWDQHDYAAIDENMRTDYIQHARTVLPGRDGVRAFFKMIESAFSDVKYTIEDMIAEGDKVAWRWTIQGRHTGPFQGLTPTGRDFTLSGMSILRLEDGKFAENWVEQDIVGLLGQLKE